MSNLTKEELRKLFDKLKEISRGKGVAEIAKRMGRTESLVYSVFRGVFTNDKVIHHALEIIAEYEAEQAETKRKIQDL